MLFFYWYEVKRAIYATDRGVFRYFPDGIKFP